MAKKPRPVQSVPEELDQAWPNPDADEIMQDAPPINIGWQPEVDDDPPAIEITVPAGLQTIEEIRRREHETLEALKLSQQEARQANAIRNFSGSTSPVQSRPEAQNKCPRCGNPYLTVYEVVKMCNPCGWRSDGHQMEPYG